MLYLHAPNICSFPLSANLEPVRKSERSKATPQLSYVPTSLYVPWLSDLKSALHVRGRTFENSALQGGLLQQFSASDNRCGLQHCLAGLASGRFVKEVFFAFYPKHFAAPEHPCYNCMPLQRPGKSQFIIALPSCSQAPGLANEGRQMSLSRHYTLSARLRIDSACPKLLVMYLSSPD